jgi:hypothetical protein
LGFSAKQAVPGWDRSSHLIFFFSSLASSARPVPIWLAQGTPLSISCPISRLYTFTDGPRPHPFFPLPIAPILPPSLLLVLALLSVNSFSLLSKTTISPSAITALCPFRLPVRLFRVSSTVFTLPGVFDPFSSSFPPAYPLLSYPNSSAYPPAAFASSFFAFRLLASAYHHQRRGEHFAPGPGHRNRSLLLSVSTILRDQLRRLVMTLQFSTLLPLFISFCSSLHHLNPRTASEVPRYTPCSPPPGLLKSSNL